MLAGMRAFELQRISWPAVMPHHGGSAVLARAAEEGLLAGRGGHQR
jgi:hypothetical protein